MTSLAALPVELLRLHVAGRELSPLELRILRRLALGDTHMQIAAGEARSYETIRKSSKVARAKLGARTSAQAVAIAVSLDLI